MPSHDERELAVFRDFAADAKLAVDVSSIEKMQPPYPDIRCRGHDGDFLHFEISEIIDSDYASLLKRFHEARAAAKRYYENLGSEKRLLFDERFSDSSIFLNFLNDATFRQREQSLPAIFDFLLALPEDRPKEVMLEESLPSTCLENISIYRDHSRSKPLFESAFGTSSNASAITVLQKKLRKTYRTDGSISLLAFWYEQPMLPEDIWLEDVDRFVQQTLEDSTFAEFWVYDWSRREIKLKRSQRS